MGMLDNYKDVESLPLPDNERKWLRCKPLDTIIVGGTCTHIFEVPIKFNEDLLKVTICYKQEARLILVKDPTELTTSDESLFIKCDMTTDETVLFGNTLLDTEVQLKFEYADKVLFSNIYKVKVINTLEED